jgi:hypothetical protein
MRRAALPTIVAVLLIGGIVPASATFPGGNGRIAYLRWTPSANDAAIFSVLPSGRERRRVPLPSDVETAAWSPDGTLVAYVIARYRRPERIVLLDTATDERSRVVNDDDIEFFSSFGDLAFDPTGSRLAICVGRELEPSTSIFTVGVDGNGLTRVAGSGGICGPDWSSTDVLVGTRFNDRWSIVTLDPDGGADLVIRLPPQPVTRSRGAVRASWSPDGGQIAFTAQLDRDRSDVFVVNADGSRLRRVRDTRGRWENDVQFAPRGNAFVVTRSGPAVGPSDLWILKHRNGGWSRVTDTPRRNEFLFAWLPR